MPYIQPPPGLSETTQETYEREAAAWDAQRDRALYEKPWLDRALRDVPQGGAVLDLGCGGGEPIGRYLVEQGFAVTGADFSAPLLDLFRERLPGAKAVLADMRRLDLGQTFDAIIGWGSFFHLTMEEQRAALPKIVAHLNPGGRLLLTVGPGQGEAMGHVGAGSPVYHASLSPQDYESILWITGCAVETFSPEDPDCRGFTLLLALRESK